MAVSGWGYFVYQGVTDPLGGINTLWPLFGIGNQMLASMALILGTVVLFKMKKERYAWVTLLPTTWLFITSMSAGWQKIFSDNPRSASSRWRTSSTPPPRKAPCWRWRSRRR